MRWRPSVDHDVIVANELWHLLQPIYDETVSLAPLARGNDSILRSSYVRRRRNDSPYIETLRSLLPKGFSNVIDLGATELDVLNFVLRYGENRILNLEGPRGVGKTTLLHFVENVLQWAHVEVRPVLLVLNGLRLSESESVGTEDFIRLIAEEMEYRDVQTDRRIKVALAAAAVKLNETPTLERLKRVLRDLQKALPNQDPMLVTFVFDNLDQLPASVIRVAADLARKIFMSSRFGSILCLRPGSRAGLMKSASARALFTYTAMVEPPAVDAWIARLGERMGNTCKRKPELLGRVASAGIDLTPEILKSFMDRFADILSGTRRRDQRVLPMLEAASASDTRHLALLIRRMLSHRSLPMRYLLGVDTDGTFYPLPAMIEGESQLFNSEADKAAVIPNLLWITNSFGGYEFLLLQRILALLDDEPIRTSDLLEWLSEFGYSAAESERGFSYLMNTILIRGSDKEKLRDARLPESIAITKAGHYYRNHMLNSLDYMTSIIVDVPLDHSELRRVDPTHFAPRLASLAEYANEVCVAEQSQLVRLERRVATDRLRTVIERISRVGCLSASVLQCLTVGVERGKLSRSNEVQRLTLLLAADRQRVEDWVQTSEARLQRLLEKLRGDESSVRRDAVVRASNGVRVELQVDDLGEAFTIGAKVRGSKDVEAAFVAVRSRDSTQSFGAATVVERSHDSEGIESQLEGAFPAVSKPHSVTADAIEVQTVPLTAFDRRVGLLSVTENASGRFAVNLCIVSGGTQKYDLSGEGASVAAVRAWAKTQREHVSELIANNERYEDAVRIAGAGLARRLLGEAGCNTLAGQYKLIDTLVVFSQFLDLPWEWITPPSDVPGEPTVPIAMRWRVIRWPWDHFEGTALSLSEAPIEPKTRTMATVGLRRNKETAWVVGSPKELEQLQKIARQHGTMHVVGHWDERYNALLVGRLKISADTADAFPLSGPTDIILSACDAASVEPSLNLAVTLAARAKCVTWAPIVKLRSTDAQRLDGELAAYLNDSANRGVDGFVRAKVKNLPSLCLYARYGLRPS
jgi:hypothetical protein